MARQVELADDLRAQQRDDVGADREAEAGKHLLGDGRAAEHVPALEHEHLAPGAREIGGGGQAVVAAADDDRVVTHLIQTGLRPETPARSLAGPATPHDSLSRRRAVRASPFRP